MFWPKHTDFGPKHITYKSEYFQNVFAENYQIFSQFL